MIIDEYTRLPDEFSELNDEFHNDNIITVKKTDEKSTKKIKKRKKAIMQMMYGRTMTATLFYSANSSQSVPKQDTSIFAPEPENSHIVVILPDTNSNSDESSTVISSESEPVFIYVDCTECNGTGIICNGDPDFGWDRGNGHGYAGCGGTGTAPCPDIHCNNGTYTCPDCGGTGIDRNGDICEICSGRGVYRHEEFCMGTGFISCMTAADHMECETCGGTGKIQTEV